VFNPFQLFAYCPAVEEGALDSPAARGALPAIDQRKKRRDGSTTITEQNTNLTRK
jgi:hypothetical protein